MKYLGIDYGTKKIGIAVSDDTGSLAFPLTVVRAGREALEAVAQLAKDNGAGALVIGESRDHKGEANDIMEDIEQFKNDLAELTGLHCEYEREFFTSTLAARQFAPSDKSRKANPKHDNLDASAAALILQSYLDRKK
ncbi:MAG: Holliday junction resolvase YqgF, putative holliday junction resolvase [Candidatus Adlerbacteria bacterium]|nr:Holliday junction resolvase YqgF, putative holliday junction resolvase [Candidatus Adlerbacteria bacterium]